MTINHDATFRRMPSKELSISPEWGFLNGTACSTTLPDNFDEIFQVSLDLGVRLRERALRPYFESATPLDIPLSLSESQYRRLWSIFGFLASAYIFSIYEADVATVLPPSLAVPFFKLSRIFNMLPILNYDGYVYNNFRTLDQKNTPAKPENFAPLLTFSVPGDEEYEGEQWFITVHVAAEKRIGPTIAKLDQIQQHLDNGGGAKQVDEFSEELAQGLDDMGSIVSRMRERLLPELYAFTTRRYVVPYQGILFSGVKELENKPQFFRGETGGQSPIPRAIAAFLELQHQSSNMAELSDHMLLGHRRYVERLRGRTSLHLHAIHRPE